MIRKVYFVRRQGCLGSFERRLPSQYQTNSNVLHLQERISAKVLPKRRDLMMEHLRRLSVDTRQAWQPNSGLEYILLSRSQDPGQYSSLFSRLDELVQCGFTG